MEIGKQVVIRFVVLFLKKKKLWFSFFFFFGFILKNEGTIDAQIDVLTITVHIQIRFKEIDMWIIVG